MTHFPPSVYYRDVLPRPPFVQSWERVRHHRAHWLVECIAEATGTFLYTYCGVGPTAAFVLGNLANEPLGSLLTIGFGYTVGILLAIVICSATSGGQFNPCVTIAMVIFRKMPPFKAVRYIIAQIFGSFVAVLLVYAQYHDLIKTVEAGLAAKGVLAAIQFTPQGTGGILALYTTHGANLSRVFLNEFVTDLVLAMTIWAALDPTNFLAPPAAAPMIIALAYGMAVWGFSVPGLAANSARDFGGRLAALCIYGTKAWGGSYAALAALTNILAMLVGVAFYEFVFADSSRVLTRNHVEFIEGHRKHAEMRDEGKRDGVVQNGHDVHGTTGSMEKNDGGLVETTSRV